MKTSTCSAKIGLAGDELLSRDTRKVGEPGTKAVEVEGQLVRAELCSGMVGLELAMWSAKLGAVADGLDAEPRSDAAAERLVLAVGEELLDALQSRVESILLDGDEGQGPEDLGSTTLL